MIWLDLFFGFLKVGCFTFGGGYAAIPLIREVVLSNGWLEEEALTYMIAVSESTPGPIMVTMATYIGSSQAGFLGALVATMAVTLPSFCVILLVMAALKAVWNNAYVQAVLRGLKPCIVGVILATGAYMLFDNCVSAGQPDIKALIITLLLAMILFGSKYLFRKKISPLVLIAISAVAGIYVYGL